MEDLSSGLGDRGRYPPLKMRIEIQFVGGFRDGTTLIGDTDQPRSASAYPFLTDNAQIGRRVSEMPPETRREMNDLICPPDKSNDFKRRMQSLVDEIATSKLSQPEIDSELEKIAEQNEVEFPRTGQKISFSNFKRVVYEIDSREIRNDCIYAIATYIGEDNENVMNDWPPT